MLTQVTNENTVQRFNEARYSISMDKNNTMEIILSILLISVHLKQVHLPYINNL